MNTRRKFYVTPALAASFVVFLASAGMALGAVSTTDGFTQAIEELNAEIAKKKADAAALKSQMAAYQRAIEEKRQEAASVRSELEIVQNKIASVELEIESNTLQIEAVTLELKRLESEIQDKTLQTIRQRQMIAEFLRQIDRTDQRTAIDLLLTQKTISEFFNDVQFLEESQRQLKQTLDTVQALKKDLENRQSDQSAKRAELEGIQKELVDAIATLDEQKSAKIVLAVQLQTSESRYRYELAQLQKQQANINADIAATEKKLRKTLDAEKLRKVTGETTGWMWPVPSMIVTAGFHDPDYPFRYVFEHPGVDIRAPQSTPVRATRGGYVARAKDAGMGYSYVLLVHENGLSSVYGHISRIAVKEDTYVEKGDIIAYSGGAPGTPGAGPMTTAPHLHFEIRLDGIPVNPLNYLQ
ncbi:MAG: peptidoglycan DD-metalloendopeptidase family protein [Patescibacteria group bacterium]|nr:MAG: peptidoglycan DD-metalloendopeptidase family protein [Patescibacteria group bacterium]